MAKAKQYMRRYIFIAGRSNKFWEVEVINFTMITRWGRNGTTGQALTENFSNRDSALAAAQKKEQEKLRKGYTLQASGGTLRPLEKERPANDPKAEEALRLFQQNNPGLAVNKPKRKSKPKTSASPASSKTSQLTDSSENGDVQLEKPKRKVKI
jgi:predicted DNA-binding WGR domain protein